MPAPGATRDWGQPLLPGSLSKKTTSPGAGAQKFSFGLQGVFALPLKTFCHFLPNKIEGIAGAFN